MTSNRKDCKMKRETADRHLREVACRIKEVNDNPDFCYTITEAYVFGSFVNSDAEMVSDLDIALRMERRCPTTSEQYRRRQAQCPYMSDDLMWLIWPKEEVLRYIRHRSGYISLHVLGDPEQDAIIFSDKVQQIGVSGQAVNPTGGEE